MFVSFVYINALIYTINFFTDRPLVRKLQTEYCIKIENTSTVGYFINGKPHRRRVHVGPGKAKGI